MSGQKARLTNAELSIIAREKLKQARAEGRLKKIKPIKRNDVIEKWQELKILVESMEIDVLKNAIKNSMQAGIRCRYGFKLLKQKADELRKLTLSYDKERYNERMGRGEK